MAIRLVTHIALNVRSVREAERFYVELLDMEVLFRESELEDGWATLPAEALWEDIEASGVEVGLSSLRAGGLRIALEPGDPWPGLLNHVGLHVDEDALAAIRSRLDALGCTVVAEREGRLTFDDRYGVRWECATTEKLRSTGEACGRWVELNPPG
jgi:catechol 2,3-dioxygenase-like lactoylglutathione lyase family enzyme